MELIFIYKGYIIGISVLLAAIVLNSIAIRLKIRTWYSFLNKPSKLKVIDYLFLFIVYPLTLGLISYGILLLLK